MILSKAISSIARAFRSGGFLPQVPKPSRVKNRMLLDTYHRLACSTGCGVLSDPAHIKSRGAGGGDVVENVMPLCREHHTEQHSLGWKRFSQRYILVAVALKERGWSFDQDGKLRRLWD